DLAAGLPPDFLRRRLDMAVTIGDVVELVGPDRAIGLRPCKLFGKPARDFYVVVRVLVGDGRDLDEFGTEDAQGILLFLALRIRDHDHRSIAEHLGDDGEADARISGSAFDDDAAG